MIADLSFFGLTVFRRDPTKNNNRCPPVACQSARPIVPKQSNPMRWWCWVKVFRLASICTFISAIYCQGRFVHPVHGLPFLLRLAPSSRDRDLHVDKWLFLLLLLRRRHATMYTRGNCCGETRHQWQSGEGWGTRRRRMALRTRRNLAVTGNVS